MSMMKMMNWLDLKLFRLTKHELISSLGRDVTSDPIRGARMRFETGFLEVD